MPDLDQSVVLDVKHIYAPVKENNPRQYVADRYHPQRQPRGDRDCRLGVKRRTNRDEATTETEYVWGYGSGIAVTPTPDGQALVLSDFTQAFNQNDVTYGLKLLNRAMINLGQAPRQVIADAAFDAWYIYQWSAELHSLAAIALNARGHASISLNAQDCPLCPTHQQPMVKLNEWLTDTHRLARFRCPVCSTVLKLNIEPGSLLRWRTNRSAEPYRSLYRQRSCVERVNSLAHDLGIDHPRQHCLAAVARRNTLIYIVINCHVLHRFRQRHPLPQSLPNLPYSFSPPLEERNGDVSVYPTSSEVIKRAYVGQVNVVGTAYCFGFRSPRSLVTWSLSTIASPPRKRDEMRPVPLLLDTMPIIGLMLP